jgi:membrane protein
MLPAAALAGYVAGRRRGRATARSRVTARANGKPSDAETRPRTKDAAVAEERLSHHDIPSPEQLPGVYASDPRGIPPKGWRQILRRAWRETQDDGIPLLAAGVAFYGFLALFPALIAAVTVYGLVADPAEVQEQVQELSDAMPAEVAQLIGDQLTQIAAASDRALGFGLVVSLLGALFAASGGVANVVKAINLAYDERETRGLVKLRTLALVLTLGAVVFVAVAVGLVAVLPLVLEPLALGTVADVAIGVARWVGLAVFMLVSLAILYRYAPDRDRPRFSWVSVGAVVATVLWLLGSVGFSIYVTNFGSYGRTYGSLAGVAILMLWLYLTSFVVLLGAEVNSEMEHQTAEDSTVGPARPLGHRRAVMADSVAEAG